MASAGLAGAMPPLPPFVVPLQKDQCVYTKQYCEENVWKLAAQLLQRLPPEAKEAEEASSSDTSLPPQQIASSAGGALSPLPAESLYDSLRGEHLFVVFISSSSSEFMLYKQASGSPAHDGLVIWDYHVLLVAKPRPSELSARCTCGRVAPALSSDLSPAAKTCPCAAWVYDLDSTLPFPCPMRLYAQLALRAHLAQGKGPSARRRERLFRVVGAQRFLSHFASDRSHMLAPIAVLDSIGTRSEGQASASASAVPASSGGADEGATRREVAQETQVREASQASWNSSSVAALMSGGNPSASASSSSSSSSASSSAAAAASQQQRQYIAPPPPYPPIRTAASRNNLDMYRFFNFPDSGVGCVMKQDEMLEFFHVAL